MNREQGGPQAVVRIRTPRHGLIGFVVYVGVCVGLAAIELSTGQPGFPMYPLGFVCLIVADSVWLRTTGVDLTAESANVRGLRRRRVPWGDVQAVVRYQRLGTWVVRLILANGQPVLLRAPSSTWGFGAANYERDFHRIGQCWLARRGQSWRPLRPEAPPLLVQG
jgi:hypothetical protein